MHQNFEVMAGLNNRFIRDLFAHVFSTYKTRIMTTSNDFTTCPKGTGKQVLSTFSLVHISFSKNFVHLAYAEF